MGRKKIKIALVEDPNTRQVTFSKRRTGLFKKANELSILCGAEVAIVVFSPGNKPYSFGHPDVEAVAAKFLQQEPKPKPNDDAQSSSTSDEVVPIDTLNLQHADVMAQLREAEKKALEYDEVLKQHEATKLSELKKLEDSYLELQYLVKTNISEIEVLEFMSLLSQGSRVEEIPKVPKKKRRTN